jgi:ATP-dependent RNA helicase RhlE
MSFDNLGLSSKILLGIKFQGYVTPTPIQKQAIPIILEGGDMLGGAQTGTGKTAAFTLPVLQLLSNSDHPGGHRPRALVLAPTRELAAQVGESVKTYGKGLDIRSTIIFGGVGAKPQIDRLRKGVDIVIGTPGRLLDLAGQKHLDLSRIEILILDEADRMLDMGFIHDIRKIIKLIPKKRQTLFFSATYSKEIKTLADTILNKPKLVEVARQNTAAETVDQCVYHTAKSSKRKLLSHLINEGNWQQVLVFTRTKHGANRLARQLEIDGIKSLAIHGNKSQSARTRALAEFKAKEIQALVATDIAARGLDIDRLPHVVNYELPNVSEDYVHRIGRTGRAGCEGEATSLVSEDEKKFLRDIERMMKKNIPVKTADGFVPPTAQERNAEKEDSRRGDNSRGRSGGYKGKGGNRSGGGSEGGNRSGGNRSGGGGGGGGNRTRSRNSGRSGGGGGGNRSGGNK